MKTITSLLVGCCCSWLYPPHVQAQTIVNAYARVTNISGTTLHLSHVNETFDQYEDGDQVLIWQVQDDVVGANTANTPHFGDLAAIGSAGLFEWATIATHVESGGVPVSLTFTTPLQNNYQTGPNSRVQVVSMPSFGTPNYTTVDDVVGLPWDGNVGGVIALQVPGALTLQHNIDADGLGFRGGANSRNRSGPACTPTPYTSGDNEYGQKGEGLQPRTNPNFGFARGKMANGGGGGNHHNGGGGGGSNFSAGGEGGQGWNGGRPSCPNGNDAGGFGGQELSPFVAPNRLFFGGGGGGGQQNNSVGSAGSNGGGFVFLRAASLVTTGSCTGRQITANGQNSSNGGNDGMGGAGAGGSILLDVPQYRLDPACPLTVAANGGNGGRVGSATHGGGGGGGQGVVVYTTAIPNHANTTTLNGIGGCNNNSNPCNNRAASGAGPDHAGILANVLLPLQWAHFEGTWQPNRRVVDLQWGATVVGSGGWFTLERSADAVHFEALHHVEALPQPALAHYTHTDAAPLSGTNYYRLRWVTWDGRTTYSKTIAIEVPVETPTIAIYPNPARDQVYIKIPQNGAAVVCRLFTLSGKMIPIAWQTEGQLTTVSTADLPRGIYLIQVQSEQTVKTIRLVLE